MATSSDTEPPTLGQARPSTATSTNGGFGGSAPQLVTSGGSAPQGGAEFEDAVIAAVRAIQSGEVMTCGEVAEHAGFPGRARGVGRVLAISAEEMPWWRVVGAGWRLISPSLDEQRRLLVDEGWLVTESSLRRPGL